MIKIEYYKSKMPIELLVFFDTRYKNRQILKKNHRVAEITDVRREITFFPVRCIVNVTLTKVNNLLILLIIRYLYKSTYTIPVRL